MTDPQLMARTVVARLLRVDARAVVALISERIGWPESRVTVTRTMRNGCQRHYVTRAAYHAYLDSFAPPDHSR